MMRRKEALSNLVGVEKRAVGVCVSVLILEKLV